VSREYTAPTLQAIQKAASAPRDGCPNVDESARRMPPTGKQNREIARMIGKNNRTVERRGTRAEDKRGVPSRVDGLTVHRRAANAKMAYWATLLDVRQAHTGSCEAFGRVAHMLCNFRQRQGCTQQRHSGFLENPFGSSINANAYNVGTMAVMTRWRLWPRH